VRAGKGKSKSKGDGKGEGTGRVHIPRYVSEIGVSCFEYSRPITTIDFASMSSGKSDVRKLGPRAFACTRIQKIEIPQSVLELGPSCFQDCRELVEVTFNGTTQVTVFPQCCFSGCHLLPRIIIPSKVREIGKSCFADCSALMKISFDTKSELESIHSKAFDTEALHELCLPAGIRRISGAAFHQNLRDISFASRGTFLEVIDGILYGFSEGRSHARLIRCCHFRDFPFVVPSCVEILDSYSFAGCSHIETLLFESATTLSRIKSHAFVNSSINEIVIPQTVEMIGHASFFRCRQLRIVIFETNSSLSIIKRLAFSQTTLQSIIFPSFLTELGESSFENCLMLTDIIFSKPFHLQRIGPKAFAGTALHIVVIPGYLCHIHETAFPDPFRVFMKPVTVIPPGLIAKWNWLSDREDLKVDDLPSVENHRLALYRSPDFRRLFFVKTMDIGAAHHGAFVANFLSFEKLIHPSILPVVGYSICSECIRVAFPATSPFSLLRDILAKPPAWWTPTIRFEVILEIACAMEFAYETGFIHGRLCSSAVLFDDDDDHSVKLNGFRRGGNFSTAISEFEIRGQSDHDFDQRANELIDIRLFGVLLIEIFTGSPTSKDVDWSEVGDPPNVDGLRQFWQVLARKGWDEDARTRTFSTIVKDLRTCGKKVQLSFPID
jgi:hypothetical protein